MKLTDLINELGITCNYEDLPSDEIRQIAERGEAIGNGALLIVVKRLSESVAIFDGEGEKSPVAVICDKNAIIKNCECPIIRISSPRRALAFAYSLFYNIDYGKLKIVAVTGTNGKTTTATLIKKILEFSKHKVGFIGTGEISIGKKVITDNSYSMTTPDPQRLYSALSDMQIAGCDFCVMEASSHSIALEKLSPIHFSLAVFTNLSQEHSDFHPTMEDYFNTKIKLFENADDAVFNIDDAYGKRGAERFSKKCCTVGILNPGEVSAFDIKDFGLSGYEYIYKGKNFKFLMKQRLPGAFNVYNVLCACAAVIRLGVKPCDARRAIAETEGICGRGEIIKGKITVIIDYAHTPFALENILLFAKKLKGRGKLNVVFGCGGERDAKKRPEMARVAEKYADFITVTSDNSRKEDTASIISDILLGFSSTERVRIIPDRKEAITNAILSAAEKDIVAIIGKGAERYNIDKNGIHPFDEREIVTNAIKARKAGVKKCE